VAGGKSSAFDNDLLKLIFNATPIPNIADNAALSPLTQLFLALHTADPGAGGNQATSEATYTGYARVVVARTTAGFTVTGNSCTLAATATFGVPTAGAGEVEAYFSVGVASTGASKVLYHGPVTPNITIANGIAPQLTSGTTITES
jgi:hypothetical protein